MREGKGFTLYRGNSDDMQPLCFTQTVEEAFDSFREYTKDLAISYTRMWRRPNDNSVLVIDYGSHIDFFYIKSEDGQRFEI